MQLSVVLDTILAEREDEDVDVHPVSPRPAGAPTEPTGGAPPLPALPPPAPPAEMPPPPAPLAPQPALANRKNRRFNYSKRTLIAGPELHAPTEHGVTAKRLRGKIASCPTKNKCTSPGMILSPSVDTTRETKAKVGSRLLETSDDVVGVFALSKHYLSGGL